MMFPLSAVRAARMFDGLVAHPCPVMVLVKEGRIVDVDLTGALPPQGAELIDLGDVTLLPGLVDGHSHLVFDPSGNAEQQMADDDDVTVMTRMRAHLSQALLAGITTVRDLGDRGYLALRLRDEPGGAGKIRPEIVAAGPPITRAQGHCWYLGGEADGIEQAVGLVNAHAARGVDLIKIMATGGMSTAGSAPGATQYTVEELRAVTERAHELGLAVTAHAHAAQGIADAVAAGVDGVEHCSFMTPAGLRPDPATVEAMAAAGTFVGCTVVRPREGMPEPVLETIEPYWKNHAYMRSRGVRVVCCTDAGIGPHKPHDVLPSDVVYFASQTGATNVEALRSVTSLAAIACGLGHRKGRIALGYDADLLAVMGNPLHDLSDISRVAAVYRGGESALPLGSRG